MDETADRMKQIEKAFAGIQRDIQNLQAIVRKIEYRKELADGSISKGGAQQIARRPQQR